MNSDQKANWNGDSGRAWVRVQSTMDRHLEPLGRLALSALAPIAGEQVIDIGCGSGQTSLALADAVAPGGSVLGVDISEPLIELARARAGDRSDVRFLVDDAQQHDFGHSRFDAAFSRFGVMFFDDPVAAFRNIRSGLKRGGRIAFVCWRSIDENPSFAFPIRTALPFLPEPPAAPEPGAPGPFAFADEARVRSILTEAGFGGIRIRPEDAMIGTGSVATMRDLLMQVGLLGTALRQHPEAASDVSAALDAALSDHVTAEGVKLGAAVWVVSAQA